MRITSRLVSASIVCLASLLLSSLSSASEPPGPIYSPGGVWYVRGTHNSTLNEYFVVWASYGTGGQIQGFRLTSSGGLHPTDPGVRVIDAAPSGAPDVAYNANGNNYLVVWSDGQFDNGEIFARFLDGTGQPIGSQFSIFQGAGAQTFPRVVYNPEDNVFAVVWSRIGGSGLGGRVAMQMISGDSATPTLIGSTAVLETGSGATPLHPHSPQIAWNEFTNKLFVAWTSTNGVDLVRGQIFNGDGSASTGVFTVADLAGNDKIPSVAANSKNGEFLIAFDNGVGISLNVYATIFNSNATLVKAPFPISTTFNIPDFRIHAAYNADADSYLVTYNRGRACGPSPCDDVLGRTIAPDGTLGPVLGVANDNFLQNHGSDDGFGSWGDLVASTTQPDFLELYQVNGDDINGGIVSLAPPAPFSVMHMYVDSPTAGATVAEPFVVSGWAVDLNAASAPSGFSPPASLTGVDAVEVWITPAGGSPAFLGNATLGVNRPDVGTFFGDSRFDLSGFQLTVNTGLALGDYTLQVKARSTVTGTFDVALDIPITVGVPSNMRMYVDVPSSGATVTSAGFIVSGWALDLDASSGSGVDAVTMTASPSGGGSPIDLGSPTLNINRPDVGTFFGSSQFDPSGFSLDVHKVLTPGNYVLAVSARSTVSGTFDITQNIPITVPTAGSMPRMYVDVPLPGAVLSSGSFSVSGWAIDLAASTGTGVNLVTILATPHAGGPVVNIGTAAYGLSRPDVGAFFGSSQFNASGFALNAGTILAPGDYTLTIWAFSTVAGTFNNSFSVEVTVGSR